MDKEKIQEKARDVAKFALEVIDDIFGKRILIFAYILAALFAGTSLFQVFTKYVYEEGFSTERLICVIRFGFCENISGMPEIPTYCLYIDIKLMMGCSQSDLRIQLSVIPFRMCRVFSNEGFFQRQS